MLATAVAALAAAAVSDIDPALQAALARDLKFSPAELADLERGRIVRHSLGSSAPGEVAAVGAVRVNARKETLVERYRDITQFKRGPDVLQIGRFGNPPTLDDLAALTITREDLDLRGCRVRDCDVRLPEETIARFQREIDWKAPDANARAAVLYKQVLFDHVRAYVSGGPGLITQYDDMKRPIRLADDFAGLLKNSPYLGTFLPGLAEHLQAFAVHPLADADDFLYWSKEKFGLTPFITVTHVTMSPGSPGSPESPESPAASGRYVIASRDVYSSRYVDASLSLTVASDAVAQPNAFYLVYVNRSRANALKGSFAALRRSIVERRTREALDETLKAVKQRIEKGS